MSNVDELNFTLEFNSDMEMGEQETTLFDLIYSELEPLSRERSDLTSAAATVRHHGRAESPRAYEATIVAYIRPENIAATKKANNPHVAIEEALDAVVRQIRDQRAELDRPWEKPENDPEVMTLMDAQLAQVKSEEIVEEIDKDDEEAWRLED